MKKKVFLITLIIVVLITIYLLVDYLFTGNAKKIMVIGYHKFVDSETKEEHYKDNKWIDTIDNLEYNLKVFKLLGYKTISMEKFECWRKGRCKLPKRTVLLTFDDGDKGFYYEVAPLLKKYDAKATVFIIGEHTEDNNEEYDSTKKQFMSTNDIKKLKKEYKNIEIENHSYGMHKDVKGRKIVYSMHKKQIKEDFDKMKKYNMNIFCYPGGAYTKDLIKELDNRKYKMAFRYDVSQLTNKNDKKFLVPRVSITNETGKDGFIKWVIKSALENIG